MPPKPGPSTQPTQPPKPAKTDKELVKNQLEAVLDAHKNLEMALDRPGLQGSVTGKPEFDDKKLAVELKKAEEQLGKHEEQRKKEDQALKNIVHTGLKEKVFRERDGYVKKTVGDEISRQVKEQVGTQISGFLPVTLEDQLGDANKRLEEMKMALRNSEARLENGGINTADKSDWRRQLREIVKNDGTKSSLWPTDLASLFVYEEKHMSELMTDYGLNSHPSRTENFNRFIQYIGVRGRLTVMA